MARVAEVGEAVSSVTPGDLVVVPFQISCGTCRACQAGRTGNCESVALGSMYGYEPFGGPWGGFLADKVRVPYADAMLVRLSPAIDPAAVASLSDNVADAWRTVGPPLAEAPGSEVLIVGGAGGSVPLYAIQLALALGAPIVHYLDTDQRALALAAQLGAQASEVRKGSFPRRLGPFAITVDASMNTVDAGQAEPVADGIHQPRRRGRRDRERKPAPLEQRDRRGHAGHRLAVGHHMRDDPISDQVSHLGVGQLGATHLAATGACRRLP